MTEREIKTLLKLLIKFRDSKELNSSSPVPEARTERVERDGRINSVIGLVIKWVKWYAQDDLNIDI